VAIEPTVDVAPLVSSTEDHIALDERWLAHNYHPLPVVLSRGEGAWVWDVEGRRYLDCLAGYSALNFGHAHPRLIAVAREQLETLTLVSRAFHNDQLGPFARDLAELTGMDRVLPMNTGAEAVETALKVARKWGYDSQGVASDRAEIIVAAGNFHGRTISIVSFSTDPVARDGFGPYTPGFVTVPYGDAEAIESAVTPNTVAVLIEPIQGEAGVIIPPAGYLKRIRDICTANDILMLADEIQSGLGRTGETFACDHEGVRPDLYILGKALGGGILPVSAIAARAGVLDVITPGTHGSTFGGNPLAAAIGREVVAILQTGEYQTRSRRLGEQLAEGLRSLEHHGLRGFRARGLWAGVDVDPDWMTGRQFSEALLSRGILAKETHESTIRLAPPLTITHDELGWLLEQFEAALRSAR
jgi:ornithine--oxo-acid transaminase